MAYIKGDDDFNQAHGSIDVDGPLAIIDLNDRYAVAALSAYAAEAMTFHPAASAEVYKKLAEMAEERNENFEDS